MDCLRFSSICGWNSKFSGSEIRFGKWFCAIAWCRPSCAAAGDGDCLSSPADGGGDDAAAALNEPVGEHWPEPSVQFVLRMGDAMTPTANGTAFAKLWNVKKCVEIFINNFFSEIVFIIYVIYVIKYVRCHSRWDSHPMKLIVQIRWLHHSNRCCCGHLRRWSKWSATTTTCWWILMNFL